MGMTPGKPPGEASDPRKVVIDFLMGELLGPESDDEELSEPPTSRYLCGMLAPSGTSIESTEDDSLASGEDDDEAGSFEAGAPMAQSLYPSSIGLSFLVETTTKKLEVIASWGQYERIKLENQRGSAWRRSAFRRVVEIDLVGLNRRHPKPLAADGEIRLEWVVRKLGNVLAVSLFLNNAQKALRSARKDERWLFQPNLQVGSGRSQVERPFACRSQVDSEFSSTLTDADLQSNQLLYRDRDTFAVGHGVAVDWEDVDLDSKHAGRLTTLVVPSRSTPRVVPRLTFGDLSMSALAGAESAKEVGGLLMPVLEEYASWIAQQRSRLTGLTSPFRETGAIHLDECDVALNRMREGLRLIVDDPQVFKAFGFANRVMLLQRSHADWAAEFRRTKKRDRDTPVLVGNWFPFQVAFILLNLSGLADPSHTDRGAADLLWFPTGGGKTEAYLGLAAFVIGLRRLRGARNGLRGDRGVTVLMRYTLRLLTVQQFQRAATLICACEVVRRSEISEWGASPFSIGLWVGGQTTPNSFEESEKALTDLIANPTQRLEGGNPAQIVSCPWCGEDVAPKDYECDRMLLQTRVWCPREACTFSRDGSRGQPRGLPLLTVDEEVYRECPTLLLATVDKFARMPWRGEVQSLFGAVERYCERHGFITSAEDHPNSHQATAAHRAANVTTTDPLMPPELVIQDELHLISGPLGTMVGLYESAVDWLCAYRVGESTIFPKVVASTATIRRASEQVERLFCRRLRTFPPPAIDAGDSYFAQEVADTETDKGRSFLGVFAPGKSMKTAVDRVYGAILAAGGGLAANDPKGADPYMTLVGYFNSLRELGGTVRLLEDDIPGWLKRIERRGGPHREITLWHELTSRVDSSQIPGLLNQLEFTFDERNPEKVPIDVVLASNMLSVGVDVRRLGIMAVTGQPKTTAEYIQATSRIGRRHPGLVVTVYNWSRFRDISHYEMFRPYHDALYKFVEGVSVTPYSSRARDRGLHAVLVSMTRLGVSGFAPEERAVAFDPTLGPVRDIVRAIVARASRIAGPVIANEVERELNGKMDEWRDAAVSGDLRYSWRSRYGPPTSEVLLFPAGTDEDGRWATLNSLREVEPQAGVYLLKN